MNTEVLLLRLDWVRATGPGRWLARCPAPDDRHPSLAIQLVDDGRTLLHCFAGCAVEGAVARSGSGYRPVPASLIPGREAPPNASRFLLKACCALLRTRH